MSSLSQHKTAEPGASASPTTRPGGRAAATPTLVTARPAGLTDRALARAVDYVLLFVLSFVVVSLVIVGELMDADAGLWGIGQDPGYPGLVTAVLVAAIYWAYFAVLESRTGWTVGKMLFRLEVRGPGGNRPTLSATARRNAFTALGLLGIIPVLGGALAGVATLAAVATIAVTTHDHPGHQGWHDRMAGGTTVVKVG